MHLRTALCLTLAVVTVAHLLDSSCARREPVEYPPTWPITDLVVPADSWKAPLSVAYTTTGETVTENRVANRGMPGEGRTWAIGFGTDLDIDDVYSHFDHILRPLGYLIHRDDPYVRGYVSQDGWTAIGINIIPIPFQGQKPTRPHRFSLRIFVAQNEPATHALDRAIPIPDE